MNLAHRIDHTILAPQATGRDIHKVVAQAIEHGFASVCVNGVYVQPVAKALKGSGVKTCGVVGFPLGANKTIHKAMEATGLAKDGAQEIDFVAYLPFLLAQNWQAAKSEFLEVVKAARSVDPQIMVKVIIESALLLKDIEPAVAEARIESAARAARESGCDFIKTSTGFHPAGGASVRAVELIKKHACGLYVKASGGIRTYDDAVKMLEAGADRLGCSASVEIITKQEEKEPQMNTDEHR